MTTITLQDLREGNVRSTKLYTGYARLVNLHASDPLTTMAGKLSKLQTIYPRIVNLHLALKNTKRNLPVAREKSMIDEQDIFNAILTSVGILESFTFNIITSLESELVSRSRSTTASASIPITGMTKAYKDLLKQFNQEIREEASRVKSAWGTKIKAVASAISRATSPSPQSVPIEGDPNFFNYLLAAQSALEDIRFCESKRNTVITWHGLSEGISYFYQDSAKNLARETVLSIIRFIGEKMDAPSVPAGLLTAIDSSILEVEKCSSEIKTIIDNNNKNIPTDARKSDLKNNLVKYFNDISRLRVQGLTAQTAAYTTSVEKLITDIQNSVPPSLAELNTKQLEFVKYYDTVAIRNVAADAAGRSLMEFPTTSDTKILPSIDIAQDSRIKLGAGIQPSTRALGSPNTTKQIYDWVRSASTGTPLVKDLGSAFGKRAAQILKQSSLSQSPEFVKTLVERRASQLKSSLSLSYVSDLNGRDKPFMPTKVIDSLLPFVLISNILLAARPSADGSAFIDVGNIGKIKNIEVLLDLVILMSDSRRILADNLELTFEASNFGYFVESAGIKVLEKITHVITEIPNWTKKISKMSPARASEKDIIYTEKAMIAIVSVIGEYCSICRPRSGALCDLLPRFSHAAPPTTEVNNITRSVALRSMAEKARSSNPQSIFGDPLISFCDAVDILMTNAKNVESRDKSLQKKLEKSEGTAEERAIKSMKDIHELLKGADYNTVNNLIDWSIIKKILHHLEDIIRDLVTIEKVQRTLPTGVKGADELEKIIGDLRAALIKIREQSEYEGVISPWIEGKSLLTGSFEVLNLGHFGAKLNEKQTLQNLYRDITFVTNNRVQRDFAQALRTKERIGQTLPAAETPQYVKALIDEQNLPAIIDKTALISTLVTENVFKSTREWYDNLGKALNDVYGGQSIKTAIDYNKLIKAVKNKSTHEEMNLELIKIALSDLVGVLIRKTIPEEVFNIKNFGEELYIQLAPLNLNIPTEVLAKSIADTASRIPSGVAVDSIQAAKEVAKLTGASTKSGHKPSSLDLTRILIACIVTSGAQATSELLAAVPDRKVTLQERLAFAAARVGSPPPAWMGIALPPSKIS